jgi:ribosomal protein S18 acetylase RimI-like enzyme
MLGLLPRLFLDLFWTSSLVAEGTSGELAGELAGFLVGVLSPSDPAVAYVHFVGVAPAARRQGLAERLYGTFFDLAVADGRRVVRAVTSPTNQQSAAFHTALGFTVRGPVEGHDGPGTRYLLFHRRLG